MRTFVQKPKAAQQNPSTMSALSRRVHGGQSSEVNSLLHLQRTLGNQAVLRLFKGHAVAGKRTVKKETAVDSGTSARRYVRFSFTGLPIPMPFRWAPLLVAITAPLTQPLAAPGGAAEIEQRGGGHALGYTELPTALPPTFSLEPPVQQPNGKWKARVRATTEPRQTIESYYPGPGVHDLPALPSGQARHAYYTDQISNLIRQGEQEHIYDLAWAHHLVSGAATQAINSVAAQEPSEAATAAEATTAASTAVRRALPAQLRWDPVNADPLPLWSQVYGRLAAVTADRDTNHWHSLSGHYIYDPAEKTRLGVPVADELIQHDAGGQIGMHDSEALVRARFAALPTGTP